MKSTTVTYALSTSGATPPTSGWQAEMPSVTNGKYLWTKTVLTYGDGTESDPIYSVGYSGTNGTSPTLPTYIKSTYIDEVEIRSPTIMANTFQVYPNDETDYTGSFDIYGMYEGSTRQYHMFQIAYSGESGYPYVKIWSPAGATMYIGNSNNRVNIQGVLDLSEVKTIYWPANEPTLVPA